MRFAPARAAACGLATLLCLAPAALAEPAGTGLFAPVARQLHADLERLRSLPPGAVTPGRIELLLATGQADAAARELGRLRGEPRAVAVAKARVLLARQDFAAARPVVAAIAVRRDLDDRERQVVFAWAWVHDDAARVDTLTLGASLAPATTAPLPDLLAAGRLACELLRYARAESCFARAIERTAAPLPAGPAEEERPGLRSAALAGMAQVLIKRRDRCDVFAMLSGSCRPRREMPWKKPPSRHSTAPRRSGTSAGACSAAGGGRVRTGFGRAAAACWFPPFAAYGAGSAR